ncbi:MAG: glycosyltransferase family 39 protein [Gordonia sp. (in: high G+C Gram-positive bacteria)]
MTTTLSRSPAPDPQPADYAPRHADDHDSAARDGSGKPSWRRPWERVAPRHWALIALLAATAVLYTWNLSRNGWGNDFYAAAAQAGGMDWKAWLFGSLDPNNAITVDKPPAALWATGLSVRIFGLSSWSILVPQALMGVASVGVLYATVRRVLLDAGSSSSATGGGLLAGAILALTPAAALIFRFNNPDALLVLLLTVAAYCTVRACTQASAKWLALCGVALGFAFLTKMLQGLLVLPGFGLAYLLFAQTTWLRRIRDLVLATIALVVSAGWYVLLVELWPADSRPYIGGSTDNSFMDLVLGYNGLARIFGNSGGGGGQGGGPGGGGPGGGGSGSTGTSFGGDTGLARLFSNEFGNEISWLLPAALLVLGVAAVLAVLRFWPAARRRVGLADRHASRSVAVGVTVFGSWLVVNGVIFAYMSGTVHPYYTVALAPAIAALVAIGAVIGWRERSSWLGTGFLAALLVSATGWGGYKAYATGFGWPVLGWVLGAATVVALVALVLLRGVDGRRAAGLAAGLVLAGGIAIGSFGIATANTSHSGSIPTAVVTAKGESGMGGPGGGMGGGPGGPGGQGGKGGQGGGMGPQNPSTGSKNGTNGSGSGMTPPNGTGPQAPSTGSGNGTGSGKQRMGGGPGGGMGGQADAKVIALLKNTDTEWAAAVSGAQSQASLQLNSGKAVIAIGGFTGSDPAPTLAQFKQWVAQGKIGYYIAGGGGGGGPQGSSDIATWVSEHYTATKVGNTTVYKLT